MIIQKDVGGKRFGEHTASWKCCEQFLSWKHLLALSHSWVSSVTWTHVLTKGTGSPSSCQSYEGSYLFGSKLFLAHAQRVRQLIRPLPPSMIAPDRLVKSQRGKGLWKLSPTLSSYSQSMKKSDPTMHTSDIRCKAGTIPSVFSLWVQCSFYEPSYGLSLLGLSVGAVPRPWQLFPQNWSKLRANSICQAQGFPKSRLLRQLLGVVAGRPGVSLFLLERRWVITQTSQQAARICTPRDTQIPPPWTRSNL